MAHQVFLKQKVKDQIKFDLAEAIIYKAKDMAPVDDGDLLAGIKYSIDGNTITITSNVSYSSDLEYGTPPTIFSPAEKGQITRWAKKHGIKNPKGTAKYVAEHGIEVGTVEDPLHVIWQGRNSYRPYLRPAIFQTCNEVEFKKIVKGGLKK